MSQADMATSCWRGAENCFTVMFVDWAEYKPRTHALYAKLFLSHTQSRVFPCLSPQSPVVMECEIHKLESGSVKKGTCAVVGLEGKHTTVVPDRLSARGTTHSSDVTSCPAAKEIPSSIQLHSHSHTHRAP